MEDLKTLLAAWCDEDWNNITTLSDTIWDHPELAFREEKSSSFQKAYLEERGFRIRSGFKNLPTAFTAEVGFGYPVIGILGEFDALDSLAHPAGKAEPDNESKAFPGHGCGHNLLGSAGILAATVLKKAIETKGLQGTVRYYGCPGEEGGSGKTFMVRDGSFSDLDIALTWHPDFLNLVWGSGTLANYRMLFSFQGRASHAGSAPHLGRSALDAVELMDVGANYLREHIPQEARIHYAILDTGGRSPNVVQPRAQVIYAVRAPQMDEVKDIAERVLKIAEGASLMTETTMEHRLTAAYSDYVANPTLSALMQRNLSEHIPVFSEEEKMEALRFQESLTENQRKAAKKEMQKWFGLKKGAELSEKPLVEVMAPLSEVFNASFSTDTGDVSWIVPMAQCSTAGCALGTPKHTWQMTAQGKSTVAKKGMVAAAKAIALTVLDCLLDPSLVEEAKKTHLEVLDGRVYSSPILEDEKPFLG